MSNLAYDTGTACVQKVARLSACAILDGYCYDYAGFACVSGLCNCFLIVIIINKKHILKS